MHSYMSKTERAKFARCGSWVDEVYQLNPFLSVKDTGGSNGADDVKFKRMLRTERFVIDLPDSVDIAVDHRSVYVVERIFLENYENVFIQWTVRLADNSVQNPYKFIALHDTDANERRDPDTGIVRLEEVRVKESSILAFRDKAAFIIAKAQRRALLPHKKKVQQVNSADDLPPPVEMKL